MSDICALQSAILDFTDQGAVRHGIRITPQAERPIPANPDLKLYPDEFHDIYKLEVVPIPTHRPMIRADQNDQIYRTKDEKFAAVVEDIVERHATGQPVLVGTISVEVSEHLSTLLGRRGIPHEVLNAKNHEREALIIEKAGEPGAVAYESRRCSAVCAKPRLRKPGSARQTRAGLRLVCD